MSNRTGRLLAGITLTALSTLMPISLGSGFAEAAVYCKTAGVPDGCVARPPAAAGTPGRTNVAGVGAGAPAPRNDGLKRRIQNQGASGYAQASPVNDTAPRRWRAASVAG